MEEKYQEWFDNFSDQLALSEISGIGELHVVRCAFIAGYEASQQSVQAIGCDTDCHETVHSMLCKEHYYEEKL